MNFDECTKTKVKKMHQRMFFLRKLKSFHVDRCVLQMFYKSVLQSILSFGLTCVFGNMRVKDQMKLQRMIKMASRVIGCSQTSAEQLCKDLIVSKAERILNDPAHPLYSKFKRGCRGNGRILQRKITTNRFGNSFIPSAIRLLNDKVRR